MRIVQIVPFIGRGTGVAGVAANLEDGFRELGCEVEAFTFHTASRGRVRPWPDRPLARRLARSWRVIWFSTVGTHRAKQYLAERPDAVSICHNNVLAGDIYVSHGVVWAAMHARGRGVWRMLRNPTHIFTYWRDRIRYRGRVHRRIVALSQGEAASLRRAYGRIRPPLEVIPNGVDLERFRPPSADERAHARGLFHLDDDARVMLFIGHEFERKGLAHAIDALAHAPTVLLLVVGGAAEPIAEATAQAERAGVRDRVLFIGPRNDLPTFFAASDVFVLPSSYESNALVVLEALASGLPVLATRVGYAPEVIADGSNGYLVAQDAAEIGDRFEELAAADLAPWRERARQSVAGLGWRDIASRYVALAEEIQRERDGGTTAKGVR